MVDAPRIDAKNVMPPIVEVTTPSLAYLRLHGRNAATWNTGRTVAERFDHVYTEQEMEEWLDPVLDMAERAQEVAVVFNNNARDHALRNAAEFAELISAARRPASGCAPTPRCSRRRSTTWRATSTRWPTRTASRGCCGCATG